MTRPLYTEYAPAGCFKSFVECFWTIVINPPPDQPVLNRVLPDGCMDIIVDASPADAAIVTVVGPMSRALDVTHTSAVDLLGVRFRPGVLPTFLQYPAHELLDERVDLDVFWKSDASYLRESIPEHDGLSPRLQILYRILLRHLPSEPSPVARGIDLAEHTRGLFEVDDLADRLGVGRRQVERRFNEYVGLSPKQTARIIRLRRVIRTMTTSDFTNWAQLAIECGYYDQAHLIRDFRKLTGTTPEAYRTERAFEERNERAPDVAFVQ